MHSTMKNVSNKTSIVGEIQLSKLFLNHTLQKSYLKILLWKTRDRFNLIKCSVSTNNKTYFIRTDLIPTLIINNILHYSFYINFSVLDSVTVNVEGKITCGSKCYTVNSLNY